MSTSWVETRPNQVQHFLTLSEPAQRLYLHFLVGAVARHGWPALVEMLSELQEDERSRDLVTRLGALPRARA